MLWHQGRIIRMLSNQDHKLLSQALINWAKKRILNIFEFVKSTSPTSFVKYQVINFARGRVSVKANYMLQFNLQGIKLPPML